MAENLVSVVIAAYQAAGFIAEAVKSAQAQSHTHLEILVVDDYSTDETTSIVAALAAADARVRLLRLPAHQGVSAARNAGLQAATGDYAAVLDADDRFAPARIKWLLDFALSHELDLVADNLMMHDFQTGAALGLAFPETWMVTDQDATPTFMLERDIPGAYRREIGYIKPLMRIAFLRQHNIRYAEDITAAEDFLFYMACLAAGARLRFHPASTYLYALRAGSVSAARQANLDSREVNQRLQRMIGGKDTRTDSLLALRGAAIDYELFNWHARAGRLHAALAAARGIPPAFLVKKLADSAWRYFTRRRGWRNMPLQRL